MYTYRGLHVRRESLGFVCRSRAILCRPEPNPSVTIRNLFFVAVRQVSALVDENRVSQLTTGQITQLECWVPTMVVGVMDLALDFGAFETHLECLHCTSPGLVDLERSMQQPAAVRELTGLVNSFLDSTADKVAPPFSPRPRCESANDQ
jgi:hypothetical protein